MTRDPSTDATEQAAPLKWHVTTLKLDDAEFATIKALSTSEQRSMHGQIRCLLIEALKARGAA